MAETDVLVIILLAAVFAYSLISRRLEGTVITPPMIFVILGLVVSPLGIGLIDLKSNTSAVLTFSEVALVITLLSNAAAVNSSVLKTNRTPVRLLLIGLPLTIALGAIVAALMFRNIALAEAGLIGAVLAPTDASLGQAIVKNQRIPARIRQALDVESGLNDGGSVPFFALFLIIARAEAENIPLDAWVTFAVEQIVFGIVLGIVAGLAGSWFMSRATNKNWMKREFLSIALIALALLTWLVTNSVGGSGFIAAYVAGLMIAATKKGPVAEEAIELSSTEAEAFSLGVFFILGLAMAVIFPAVDLLVVIYALLSLTVVRMVPVAVSLIDSRFDRRSVLFMGWFGPRGLASIVLMLTALESTPEIANVDMITAVVFTTVLISVFSHGITAVPAINRLYGKRTGDESKGS